MSKASEQAAAAAAARVENQEAEAKELARRMLAAGGKLPAVIASGFVDQEEKLHCVTLEVPEGRIYVIGRSSYPCAVFVPAATRK